MPGPEHTGTYEPSALGTKLRAAIDMIVSRPFKTTFAQDAPRHFAVVKFERLVGKNLIILVTLSGQQHDVSAAGFLQCHANGLFSVRLDQVFAGGFFQSPADVADDFPRGFPVPGVARA